MGARFGEGGFGIELITSRWMLRAECTDPWSFVNSACKKSKVNRVIDVYYRAAIVTMVPGDRRGMNLRGGKRAPVSSWTNC